MARLPALFLSHGSPTLAIDDCAAADFLTGLAGSLPQRPRAIIVVSAHHDAAYEGGHVTVTGAPMPPTVHDFGGFPAELYAMRYPAPGDPALATDIVALLRAADIDARLDPERGLDHGAWVPLRLAYPAADVPVVQLAIFSGRSPEWHFALGQALESLRDDGVLIVGSGSMTHNLRAFFGARPSLDAPALPYVAAFADWVAERIDAGAVDDVLHAVERAPHGRENHPTMDHILPLFVAMGAGDFSASRPGRRLHASTTYGILAMDVYAFD